MKTILAMIVLTVSLTLTTTSWVHAGANTLSPSVYKKLQGIQELMSAGDFPTAITELTALNKDVSNPEEPTLNEAIVKQTLGFVYMSTEKYDEAIAVFKRSLELEKLPDNAADNVRYLIAQLYAGKGDFNSARIYAEKWFEKLDKPKPTEAIFMANIYAQEKMYKPAAELAEMAISLSSEPKQSWFQLAVAAYFEDKRFNEAAVVLTRGLDFFPAETKFWEQLASVYMVLNKTDKALAVLKVAWNQHLLEKENTIKTMIQLAGSEGIPEHAARLLDQALAKGLVPSDETYLKLLANAWTVAREDEEAIAALSRLAAVSEDGDPWMKQGRLLLDTFQWQKAETALLKALDKGLEKPGHAWLLLGIARVEQARFDDAKAALRKAEAFEKTKSQAIAWQRYADDKRKQEKWLRRNQG